MIAKTHGTWKNDPKYNNFQGILSTSPPRILQVEWSNQFNDERHSTRTQIHHRKFNVKIFL